MEHSKPGDRDNCGENIAYHSDLDLIRTTNVATQMWYDEITDPGYDFSKPGD